MSDAAIPLIGGCCVFGFLCVIVVIASAVSEFLKASRRRERVLRRPPVAFVYGTVLILHLIDFCFFVKRHLELFYPIPIIAFYLVSHEHMIRKKK